MAEPSPTIRRVLSIAGSDSGGGAGIQADLKAFAACGVHGMTAVTAITAQSTVAVDAIEAVAPAMILAQVRSVARDIGVDAVKVGMLGTLATIEAVAQALDELAALPGPARPDEPRAPGRPTAPAQPTVPAQPTAPAQPTPPAQPPGPPVVLDPVMVAESGARLLDPAARHALIRELLPRVTVLTPNLPEARVLAGAPDDEDDAHALARAVHLLGPRYVVVTGGHRAEATDVFFDGEQTVEIPGERYPAGAAHGSGCTHSSVLAARLALGDTPLQAARESKRRAAAAVRDGLSSIGAGSGPVDVLAIGGRGAIPLLVRGPSVT